MTETNQIIRVALVGGTGTGKTTLADNLSGHYENFVMIDRRSVVTKSILPLYRENSTSHEENEDLRKERFQATRWYQEEHPPGLVRLLHEEIGEHSQAVLDNIRGKKEVMYFTRRHTEGLVYIALEASEGRRIELITKREDRFDMTTEPINRDRASQIIKMESKRYDLNRGFEILKGRDDSIIIDVDYVDAKQVYDLSLNFIEQNKK